MMAQLPVRTSINGEPAEWTAEIRQKWTTAMDGTEHEPFAVSLANYYTPRPYVDDYNRGSRTEGFTYVINQGVYFCVISRDDSDPRRPYTVN